MVVMERTQAQQISPVAFELDTSGLGQALQGDFGFEAVDLIVGDSGYIVISPKKVEKYFDQATMLDRLAR